MTKTQFLELKGKVIQRLPDNKFRIELEDNKIIINAYISGKMKKYYIKILPGDYVTVEISPYDLTTGRITFRYK